MEKDGACKTDRHNKKCSCARKSGRRKNNAGTDKEKEKKLAGPLPKKELPAEGCSRRYGKWEDGMVRVYLGLRARQHLWLLAPVMK